MSFGLCKNCGEYGIFEYHKCKPEWEAIYVDYHEEDDPRKAFGFDAESTAERFAKKNFSAWDYPTELEIWVRKPDEIEWKKFDIEVRSKPVFSATEKKESITS